jgi:2-polyprenyl-3-methyl-5-hydroxy-6-metoxy-1,4-benzoquinol methylase
VPPSSEPESDNYRIPGLVLRAIARTLLWPIRRFFDPRFQGVVDRIDASRDEAAARHDAASEWRGASMLVQQETRAEVDQLHGLIRADMEATSEAVTIIGRSLRDIDAMVDDVWRGNPTYVDQIAEGSIEQVDHRIARLLSYANSYDGFAAQQSVWFNPPVLVQYAPGQAFIAHVNERIAEVPFVFRTLASVPPGAEVLDVGASESTLCLSLATSGYHVTAIDPRPNPLSHPNLRVVVGRIEEWDEGGPFQAIICVSTIEHIGVGAYDQDGVDTRADLAAVRRLHELAAPGGLLILTTSYGRSGADEFSRTYDQRGLDELLEGWEVRERMFLARVDETTWDSLGSSELPEESEREIVAMISATRAS